MLAAVLRVPLAGKIAGANAIIVVAALIAAIAGNLGSPPERRLLLILATALAVSLVVNVALVLVALRPLEALQGTATKIWNGDLAARVPDSILADSNIERVGGTVNALLDSLTSDRAHLRSLAAQVIRAGDRERAQIARELHDSAAQTLAALLLELSVVANENRDHAIAARLQHVRSIASDVLDEVKLLAHTVHPRVLDDLGLVAALRLLSRETEERSRTVVQVDADAALEAIPETLTSVLYRVAQEAVNNSVRHGEPAHITLSLRVYPGQARLEVVDDGPGFDVAEAERRRPGMGLFTMRERVALVGGAVRIESAKGRGTRVVATVPTNSAEAPASAPAAGQ